MIRDPRPSDFYSFAEGAGFVSTQTESAEFDPILGWQTPRISRFPWEGTSVPSLSLGLPRFRPSTRPPTVRTTRASVPAVATSNPRPLVLTQTPDGPLYRTDNGDFTNYDDARRAQGTTTTDWEEVSRRLEREKAEQAEALPDDEELPRTPPITANLPVPIPGPTGVRTHENDREDEDMAIDWGDLAFRGIAGLINPSAQNQTAYNNFMAPPAATAGPSINYSALTASGVPCKRRRRRRRLLTPTDLSDLAALATIVGKGDALKLAVTKAVRR